MACHGGMATGITMFLQRDHRAHAPGRSTGRNTSERRFRSEANRAPYFLACCSGWLRGFPAVAGARAYFNAAWAAAKRAIGTRKGEQLT
jgi:hypothetical protein